MFSAVAFWGFIVAKALMKGAHFDAESVGGLAILGFASAGPFFFYLRFIRSPFVSLALGLVLALTTALAYALLFTSSDASFAPVISTIANWLVLLVGLLADKVIQARSSAHP